MEEQERKQYYDIVVDMWKAFYADYGEEFSDEFWKGITAKMDAICQKYKANELTFGFASVLEQAFLDLHEARQKQRKEASHG